MPEQAVAPCDLPYRQAHDHIAVLFRVAQAINTGNRRDNDDVLPGHQCGGCRQAHPVDFFVDFCFFFDVQVMPRNVGFRLVIIVIRHEIFNRVFREELAEFRIELGCQRLVVRHHQRRHLQALNHIGDGKRLAGCSRAKQHLVAVPFFHPFHQLINGFRLVTSRLVWSYQFEIHGYTLHISRFFNYSTIVLVISIGSAIPG